MSKGSRSSGGDLPRVSPVSAFGLFMCCVGHLWTILSYMQTLGGINRVNPNANLQWWTILVPIYNAVYLSKVVQALNETAADNNVPGQPVADNLIFHLFLPFLSFYNIFNRWNEVADAIEGK